MYNYGISRLEIAWELSLPAGLALCDAIRIRNGDTPTTPPTKDPATYYERLKDLWLQQQNSEGGLA